MTIRTSIEWDTRCQSRQLPPSFPSGHMMDDLTSRWTYQPASSSAWHTGDKPITRWSSGLENSSSSVTGIIITREIRKCAPPLRWRPLNFSVYLSAPCCAFPFPSWTHGRPLGYAQMNEVARWGTHSAALTYPVLTSQSMKRRSFSTRSTLPNQNWRRARKSWAVGPRSRRKIQVSMSLQTTKGETSRLLIGMDQMTRRVRKTVR